MRRWYGRKVGVESKQDLCPAQSPDFNVQAKLIEGVGRNGNGTRTLELMAREDIPQGNPLHY
jgi:hypothetical protein